MEGILKQAVEDKQLWASDSLAAVESLDCGFFGDCKSDSVVVYSDSVVGTLSAAVELVDPYYKPKTK